MRLLATAQMQYLLLTDLLGGLHMQAAQIIVFEPLSARTQTAAVPVQRKGTQTKMSDYLDLPMFLIMRA